MMMVEKRGRVKTGILTERKGCRAEISFGRKQLFYPKRAERNKEAEEFLKASVEAAVETGVVKTETGRYLWKPTRRIPG